jgi:branched-chain amino acid transport system substrate-binding protein
VKTRRGFLQASGAAFAAANLPHPAVAAPPTTPFRIGVIWSYTGAGPSSGPEMDAAIAGFLKAHGDTVAGRKIEIIKRDDTGVAPETARRLAQELIVGEGVNVIAGLIFTANANAVGDISNQAKVPTLLVNSVATGLLQKNPYMVRFSYTTLELTDVLGHWSAKNGYKNVYVMYHDLQAGIDASSGFTRAFTANGGKIAGTSAIPINAGDFSAYVQRARDAQPDAVFVFLLAGGVSAQFLKQMDSAGIQKAGIKILATGDLVSENNLPQMGDAALGIVSAFHYSSAHESPQNRAYLADTNAFARGSVYPSFAGVAMTDALGATYKALAAQNGSWDADTAMTFYRGYKAESPRGPILIDAGTRDIVQNIYVRRVEKRNGTLVNAEFETVAMVRPPDK